MQGAKRQGHLILDYWNNGFFPLTQGGNKAHKGLPEEPNEEDGKQTYYFRVESLTQESPAGRVVLSNRRFPIR